MHTLTDNTLPKAPIYWTHGDHLGSTAWVTDTAGVGVQHFRYLPFGEPLYSKKTGTFSSRYTFSGKERDAESGLNYFGARYYNSDLSIWLSVDPLSDKYPNLSPYTYCADNPVRLVDEEGKEISSPDRWIVDHTNKTLTRVSNEGGDMFQYVNGTQLYCESKDDFIKEYASQGYKINTGDATKSVIGAGIDTYSGCKYGWYSLSKKQQQKFSYDLSKSLKNNGWQGQTRQLKGGINRTFSSSVSTGVYALNATIAAADLYYSYNVLDGGTFGPNSSFSLGSSVGGLGGAALGCKIGGVIGSAVGPVGTVAGGIIGSVVGGFFGAEVGSNVGKKIYDFLNK